MIPAVVDLEELVVADADKETVLIQRIKQGERASFDALVSLYQQKGLGIAYNMVGNLEDAKDVLQEAFVKVYVNIKGFQERAQFYTWFYRIVVNCSLDFLRKRKRTSSIFIDSIIDGNGEEKELEVADSRFEPARITIERELGRNLEDSIAKLSKMQRTCFVLRHQNGLSIEEISQILKCNPATVKVHIFRAIGNLRKSLSKYMV